MNLLTEYDEETYIRIWRRDGIIQGKQEQAEETANKMFEEGDSPEKIARCTGLPVEQVIKLKKKVPAKA